MEDPKWNGCVVPRVSSLLGMRSMHSAGDPEAMSV